MSDVRGVAGDSLVERSRTQARLNVGSSGQLQLESGVPYPSGGTPTEQKAWLIEHYPAFAAYVNDPDLGPVLLRAAAEDWTPERLLAEVQQTPWWRTTSDTARQFAELQRSDPATANSRIDTQAFNVLRTMQGLGLTLPADQVRELAVDALRLGYTDNQLRDAIFAKASPVPVGGGFYQGTLGANMLAVQQLAGRYGVRVSEATAKEYATRITNLGEDPTFLLTTFAAQAKAKYPWMGQLIDQGVIPQQFFEESFQVLGDELELPTETFNLTDPRWSAMLVTTDPKTGAQRAASESELRMKARNEPSWGYTNRAREITADAALGLARKLGVNV